MVWQKGDKLQGGRYVIEKVLGEGGFGITYQAQHTLLKQWVVIKTPNESLKNDSEYPNYVKRFIQEGRKLAKLSQQPHPNIVRVTELFEEGKTYCLVMDFVPGESLFNLVQKRGALPELEAVEYIKQIGEALIFVHQQGLVHRDAHPGNIMVQKNGKAVLIDFGIAGEIMPKDGYFTSHHPANIAFAPYEQMGGNRQVTIDVYTLAASLYYAVTGKRPESSLDRKLYNKPLISPNKYVVGISDKLNLAILKGMNLEAEYRPQSMREWLKLLPDFNNKYPNNPRVITNNHTPTIKIEEETKPEKNYRTHPIPKRYQKPIQNELERISNFPWLELGYIAFYYSVIGFFTASSAWGWALGAVWVWAWARTGVWGLVVAWVWTFAGAGAFALAIFIGVTTSTIGFVIFTFLLFVVYGFASQKLKTSFRKLHHFLILAAISSIGLFLGWLTYQFFPIFPNR